MTDFDQKLKAAIERGQRASDAKQANAEQKQLSDEEIRRRHTHFRLKISERIEKALKSMINQLPGFEYETVFGERGWGGAASRDELQIKGGQRTNLYSRVELTVKPLSDLHIVLVAGKGTVRNREIFTRDFHRAINEADEQEFLELVDRWILEYAQLYSAESV